MDNFVRVSVFPFVYDEVFLNIAKEYISAELAGEFSKLLGQKLQNTMARVRVKETERGVAYVPTTAGIYVPFLSGAKFFQYSPQYGFGAHFYDVADGGNNDDAALIGWYRSRLAPLFAKNANIGRAISGYLELSPEVFEEEKQEGTNTTTENGEEADIFNGGANTVTSYPTGKREHGGKQVFEIDTTRRVTRNGAERVELFERIREINSPVNEFTKDFVNTFVDFSDDVEKWVLPVSIGGKWREVRYNE